MAFNPFEHHHHHSHDHDHDHDHGHQPLDPAERSLADALRVSFFILKLVMVVLVIWYLFSGMFVVESGNVAVVLRFGEIVGKSKETQVVQPGKLNFTLPFPVDQVVRIPTSNQTMALDGSFWYQPAQGQAVNPELEMQGALITGDANVIHGKWTVRYQVSDPVDFVRNLANLKITDSKRMLKEAESTIAAAVEEGIVHAAARTRADDLLKLKLQDKETKQGMHDLAIEHAQATLNRMGAGIKIDSLSADGIAVPRQVEEAYKNVIAAENEAADVIAKARKERSELLVAAAGESHEALWALVKRYATAVDAGNAEQVKSIEAEFDRAFAAKAIEWQGRQVTISGDAASAISSAEGYRSQVETDARRDAEAFRDLKAKYDQDPRIFLARKWLAVKEHIFANPDIEIWLMPPDGQFRGIYNRDPKLKDDRERRRTEQLQKNAQKGTGG